MFEATGALPSRRAQAVGTHGTVPQRGASQCCPLREASAQVGTDKMMELAEQPHQHVCELPTVKEQGPGPDSTPPPAQPVV